MTLTNERQQALIADCEEEIGTLKLWLECGPIISRGKTASQIQRQEIALASLTSGPVGATCKHYTGCKYPVIKMNGLEFMVAVDREDAEEISEELGKLYTAPPVPVIKLPGNLQDAFEEGNRIPTQTSRCGNSYCSHSFSNWDGQKFMNEFDGFVKGINFIKHLNGLGE